MTALTKEYSAIHDLLSAGFTQEEATNAVALSMETYDTEDQYKCVCGNYFTKIIIIATENIRDATIGCNLCRLRGKKNDIFWHCYPNKCHDGSFDVCINCIDHYDPTYIKMDPLRTPNWMRNLVHHIRKIDVLNRDEDESNLSHELISSEPIDHRSYIVSQPGTELSVTISFDERIELKSVRIIALHETLQTLQNTDVSGAKQVHIHSIHNVDALTEEIKSSDPLLSITSSDQVIEFNDIHKAFGTVRCLVVCLKSKQNYTKRTFINAIRLEGTQKQYEIDYDALIRTRTRTIPDYAKEVLKILNVGSSVSDKTDNCHSETASAEDAIKLLTKILSKIVARPTEPKYSSINWMAVQETLSKWNMSLRVLPLLGFELSPDGKRLQWKCNDTNYDLVRRFNEAIQQIVGSQESAKQSTDVTQQNSDELDLLFADLLQITLTQRRKAITLLIKIFSNILSNPSLQKHGDLNWEKIQKRFKHCSPGFDLLCYSGFKQSSDKTRLLWEYNAHNYRLLKDVNDKLQSLTVHDQQTKMIHARREEQKQTILKRRARDTAFIKQQLTLGLNKFWKYWLLTQGVSKAFARDRNKSDENNQQRLKAMKAQNEQVKNIHETSRHLLGQNRGELCEEKQLNIPQFDENVIRNLVESGIATREQSIKASQIAADYKDGNSVCEALVLSQDATKKEKIRNVFTNMMSKDKKECPCSLLDCPQLLHLQQILGTYQHDGISSDVNEETISIATYQQHVYNNQQPQRRLSKIHIENILQGNLNITVLIDAFHHLLQYHDHQFDEIHNILKNNISDGAVCNVSTCPMMRRNCRERLGLHEGTYYSCNNAEDIVIQETLDSIHCYYVHSFDGGYRLSHRDRREIQQSTDTDDSKQEYEYVNDRIEIEIHSRVAARSQMSKYDVSKGTKFCSSLSNVGLNYSFGSKYFYWSYYENSGKSCDPASDHGLSYTQLKFSRGVNISAANEGYTLRDFYVKMKYRELKEELINNQLCFINVNKWNVLVQQAKVHHKSEMYCSRTSHHFSIEYFDMEQNTLITRSHIIAMMAYCNNDLLQRRFSETYRMRPDEINVQSMISRHRNYAHLGRLLRECVGLFGASARADDVAKIHLYHGMTIKSQFPSINVSIQGPISLTSEYSVAVNFCNNEGMILDMCLNQESLAKVFDCQYLSHYPNEKEMFCIGGYNNFIILSIIDV
eukprot:811920_1